MTFEGPGDSTEANVQLRYRYLKQALQQHGVTLDPNTRVLEVGSGNGIMLHQFKKDGVDGVGVDMRPRGEKENLQVQARMEQLPFSDESFDIIVSTQAFDGVVHPDQNQIQMGREIVRVLKIGGLYVGFTEMMMDIPDGLTLVSDIMNRRDVAIYKKEDVPSEDV
jgi:ubiquinone/menaquinone biosynthesis C-methylase UbiE